MTRDTGKVNRHLKHNHGIANWITAPCIQMLCFEPKRLRKDCCCMFTLLDSCVSSWRRGHANLFCIAPVLTDDPRRESKVCLLFYVDRYRHMYMHTYTYMYTHTYVCMYVCTYVRTHVRYVRTYVCLLCIRFPRAENTGGAVRLYV